MINKKSIWFLTLFSLILVLSVYYVTMPSELLLTNKNNYIFETNNNDEGDNTTTTVKEEEANVDVKESSVLVALRVEAEEKMLEQIESLNKVINSSESSTEEKNNAYEQMKSLNITRGEEEKLEKQINETYNLKAFVKVDNNQIRVVVDSKEHNANIANNIMRTIQGNYDNQMYISVKFNS